MDKLEKLRKEIERRISVINNRENKIPADKVVVIQLKALLPFIDFLQKETVSEDLKKTSKEYADKNYAEWLDFVYGDERDDHYSISEAFKAGAKWQKEQMMEKAINTEASLTMSVPTICISLPLGVNVGDKVKVIVIKED